jgi:hypothetical protein
MTTATLQTKMTDTVARLDKACGKSFIAEGQKCSKEVVGRSPKEENSSPTALAVNDKTLSARKLLTAGGLVASTALLGVLAKSGHEILASKLPDDAVPPPEPPKGLYDSFQSGDLIYQAVDFAGTKRAHYSVYVGKVNGEHRIFDVSTKKSSSGKTEGSVAAVRPIDEAHSTGSSFQPASRVSKDEERPSAEQLNKIIDQLNGKDFDWSGFKTNCETFARTITNDLPVSTQSKNVSPLTAEIVSGLMRAALPKGYKKRAIKQNEVAKIVKKTLNQDAAMNPKAQAAQILTPIFNNRPVTVMSVSLNPEGNPVGVFRGEPRPGQTHYYTFSMGQKVQFRRIMGKTDSMDEACGCTDCKKHKRTKAECECGGKTDGLTKTHKVMREFKEGTLTTHGKPVTNRKQAIAIALSEQSRGKKKKRPKGEAFEKVDALLARLDKKCGASGIPDNAKCTKAEGGAAPASPSKKGSSKFKGAAKTLAILAAGYAATNIAANLATAEYIHRSHGVDRKTARKFVADYNRTAQRQGVDAAQEFYGAWRRENGATAGQAYANAQQQSSGQGGAKQSTNPWGDSPKGSQEWARWRAKQAEGNNNSRREQEKQAASANANKTASGKDWHTVLGIDKSASPAEVKAAFRKKVRETHPDANGGKDKGFNDVNEAWAIAQKQGKVKRGDSIEMEWFIKRMDARSKVAV